MDYLGNQYSIVILNICKVKLVRGQIGFRIEVWGQEMRGDLYILDKGRFFRGWRRLEDRKFLRVLEDSSDDNGVFFKIIIEEVRKNQKGNCKLWLCVQNGECNIILLIF